MKAAPELTANSKGLPTPARHWAMLTLIISIFMAVLDGTLVNIALPSIAQELGVPGHKAVWVINAYQLAIISTLLSYSSLAARIGYRNIYLFGLATFSVMALLSAMAQDLNTLILARTLQGLGAAAIMSINSALVRQIYPISHLGQGIAVIAMVVAIGAASGPSIAAGILAFANWHWLFALSFPFGSLAFFLGLRYLPHTPLSKHAFDWVSALLTSILFVTLVSAIADLGKTGSLTLWLIKIIIIFITAVMLYRRLWDHPAPLLPLDLLRIPMFRLSVATSICAFCAQMLTFVALPFYFYNGLGKSAMETGLLITPWPIMIGIVAPIAGRLADKHDAGALGAIGLSLFAIGLFSLTLLPGEAGFWAIAWRVAICGAGFGFFQSPNNRAIMSSAPMHRSGGASGMLGTARLLGQSLGAALAGAILMNWPNNAANISLTAAAGLAVLGVAISYSRTLTPLSSKS